MAKSVTYNKRENEKKKQARRVRTDFCRTGKRNKEQDQSPCTGCTETLRVSATLIILTIVSSNLLL